MRHSHSMLVFLALAAQIVCTAAVGVRLREEPKYVVVASKNYDGEPGANTATHLSGPLRVVSTNYDPADNTLRLDNRWGGLGKSVPDAVAPGGYIVAARTGDDLDHLNLEDLNAKKSHIEQEIQRLEARLAFNKQRDPVFKHKSQLSVKSRIQQLKQLMDLLTQESSSDDTKVRVP